MVVNPLALETGEAHGLGAGLGVAGHGLGLDALNELEDALSHQRSVVPPCRSLQQRAEHGIAAHWRYKEGGKSDKGFEQKIAWLRQLLEWKEEESDADDFIDQMVEKARAHAEKLNQTFTCEAGREGETVQV